VMLMQASVGDSGAKRALPLANVPRYLAYQFFKHGQLHLAIVVPFYASRGLSFSGVMLVQSCYYLCKATFDLPTGALADVLGRRRALVAASLLQAAAYLLIFSGHSLALFALGEALAGVAFSLGTGADSALAYDSLLAAGREKRYQLVEGRAYALRLAGMALFPTLGGLLAARDIAAPYLASAGVLVVSALIAAAFLEVCPGGRRPARFHSALRSVPERIALGLTIVRRDAGLAWVCAYYAFLFATTRTAFWLYQPFMQANGLPLTAFGAIYAGLFLASALASLGAASLGGGAARRVLAALPLAAVCGFLLMGACRGPWAAGLLLLPQAVFGAFEPLTRTRINTALADSRVRATVLSVATMLANLAYAAFAPAYGALVDALGVHRFSLLFALAVLALAAGFGARRPAPRRDVPAV